MPSTIYLSSGDEFIVTASYADAIGVFTIDTPWAEFTAITWRDPEGDHFTGHDEEAYAETPVTVLASRVVAVQRLEPHYAASIERARAHQPT